MVNLLKVPGRLGGALLASAVFAAAYGAVARPGTVNYAEGQVTVNGRAVAARSLGSTEVSPGQVLRTDSGKAELLLTPGVFLRLGDHSELRMVSPSITDTRVELLRGNALLEAGQVANENNLAVIDNGVTTRIDKKGIYQFDADQPKVAVYDGKAKVLQNDQTVDVGKGKELPLDPNAPRLKPQKFDRDEHDALYNWSKLRSQYLAEANQAAVQTLVVGGGSWYGTGWYWNPYFDTWSFVPGNGLFYSPFGFGFYSPAYWYYNPPIYYYPGRGWHGGHGGRGGGTATPPPAVGGSGVQFGRPGPAATPSAPAARPAPMMRGPSMSAPAARPAAPAARPMGGGGVRFGSGGRGR